MRWLLPILLLLATACGSTGDPGTSGADAVVDAAGGAADVVAGPTGDTTPTPNPCPTGTPQSR